MAWAPEDVPDATLRLVLAPGIGPQRLGRLRARFGSDDRIIAASPRDLASVPGIGARSARSLADAIAAVDTGAERAAMAATRSKLVVLGDAEYPPLLAAIPDPPVALRLRGSLDEPAATRPAIAIVGSRRSTTYGRSQAGRFAGQLAGSGLVVVSGGARGIDAEAHRAALRVGGRTVAVMGCGLGHCYPSEHRGLYESIVEHDGALISELPTRTPPRAAHFPRRNRIIAGLSLGVLMVEAGRRSGALITGRLAVEDQGREAMALPGPVDSPASAGCLLAIRDGWAACVIDAEDVLAQLDGASQLVRGAAELCGLSAPATVTLDATQQQLVDVLAASAEPLPVELLIHRARLPAQQVTSALTMLQLAGLVRRDGGRFVVVPR